MDCDHPEAPRDCRIVNEGGWKDMKKGKMRKVIEAGVPKWCPLPDIKSEDENE